jgi:hypothetical protein
VIDKILEAVIAGANVVATLAQNKRNARQAKLDQPIGELLIEQARADMERKRRERSGGKG